MNETLTVREKYNEQYRLARMMNTGRIKRSQYMHLWAQNKKTAMKARMSLQGRIADFPTCTPAALKERKIERENEERRELLFQAKEELESAISKIRKAVHGTKMNNGAHGYIIPHLSAWLEEESYSIENLINDFS